MGRAVYTDLDGTLLGSDQQLSPANHDVLEVLGQQGILRVVVTGRSLFSCRRVLDRSFPIDLWVTSSGAGIFSFPNFKLLFDQALTVFSLLMIKLSNGHLFRPCPQAIRHSNPKGVIDPRWDSTG